MTDYTELVKALRYCAERGDFKCGKDCPMRTEYPNCLTKMDMDAAAAIEGLQSEVERLKDVIGELREAQTYIDHYGDKWMTSAKDVPTASPWHRAEELPKEDGKYVAINVKTKWWYEASYENGNWKAVDLFGQRWVVIHPTHWMPIEPPKEEEHGN